MVIGIAVLFGFVAAFLTFGLGVSVTSLAGPAGGAHSGFSIGFIAALAALIVTIVLALRWQGVTSVRGLIAMTVGALAGFGGIATVGIGIGLFAAATPLQPGTQSPAALVQQKSQTP